MTFTSKIVVSHLKCVGDKCAYLVLQRHNYCRENSVSVTAAADHSDVSNFKLPNFKKTKVTINTTATTTFIERPSSTCPPPQFC